MQDMFIRFFSSNVKVGLTAGLLRLPLIAPDLPDYCDPGRTHADVTSSVRDPILAACLPTFNHVCHFYAIVFVRDDDI